MFIIYFTKVKIKCFINILEFFLFFVSLNVLNYLYKISIFYLKLFICINSTKDFSTQFDGLFIFFFPACRNF